MKTKIVLIFLFISCFYGSPLNGEQLNESKKKKIIVISSYHKEYIWSQDTNKGLCESMLKFGYFDNDQQIKEYTEKDHITTSTMVLKKLWMNTKREKSKPLMQEKSLRFFKIIKEFQPDLILLGDDNAAKYIGTLFLDTDIPIVFWGVNNNPVKYNLLDSADRPGHNVTGIYQSGYYLDSFKLLTRLTPTAKTFAILSDSTPTGRSHLKKVEFLAHRGKLPLKLIETISVNSFELWKEKALELQDQVDAFFIAQASGLKDATGKAISMKEVAKWYTTNIHIPETTLYSLVKQGLLCTTSDSGYNQGYEAGIVAHDILANGANPSTYPARTPKRGPFMVNTQRAKSLGIKISGDTVF